MLWLTRLSGGVFRLETLFFVSIALLFIGTSLLFARLPGLVGIDLVLFWRFGGYEWPKTLWWYLLIPIIVIWALLAWKCSLPSWRVALTGGLLLVITAFHTQSMADLLGTRFLPQGSLFITALILTAWVFFVMKSGQRTATVKLLLGLSIPIGLYAIFQSVGIDPIAHYYTLTPWQDARPFSTFGSPNTLAVWCLLLMPLVSRVNCPQIVRYILRAWLLLIIALTQSLSVLIMALIYLSHELYRSVDKRQRHILAWLVLVACIATSALLSAKWYVKYLSLSSRYEIWINMLQYLSPLHLTTWIWHGPGSLLEFFQSHRSSSLSEFIAPYIPIDRAHNVLLDMLWNWWTLGTGILAYMTKRLWHTSDRTFRAVIVLFFATGFFHTPLLVHYLVLLLGVGSRKE